MIKVRDLLRLKHEQKLGSRAIGRSCNLSKSAVNDYLRLASARGLQWPLPPDLDDEALQAWGGDQRHLGDYHGVGGRGLLDTEAMIK